MVRFSGSGFFTLLFLLTRVFTPAVAQAELPGSLTAGGPVSPATASVAVLRFDYLQDGTAPSLAAIRQAVFTHSKSMAKYFEATSFGRVRLVGEVYDVPPPAPLFGSGWTACWPATDEAALEAAIQAGLPLAQYQRIIFVVRRSPSTPGCAAGNSTLGTRIFQLSIGPLNLSVARLGEPFYMTGDFSQTTQSTLAHELGHSFGVSFHANSYSCSDGQFLSQNLSTCTQQPYGDLFQMMGLRSQMSLFSSPLTERLGWLPPAHITQVTRPGLYPIYAYGDPLPLMATSPRSHTARALKIKLRKPVPIRTVTGVEAQISELYIEFRRNVGFDFRLNRSVSLAGGGTYLIPNTDGVILTGVSYTGEPGGYFTHLLPVQTIANPQYIPNSAADPYLRVGSSVSVPLNSLRITVAVSYTHLTLPTKRIV